MSQYKSTGSQRHEISSPVDEAYRWLRHRRHIEEWAGKEVPKKGINMLDSQQIIYLGNADRPIACCSHLTIALLHEQIQIQVTEKSHRMSDQIKSHWRLLR